ncbi:hypothetical protein HDU96_008324 [Phlyctochytrium bullatum]|nr:hypothetical protein HDU96_008324 [Phlyctochytrium bullatum]
MRSLSPPPLPPSLTTDAIFTRSRTSPYPRRIITSLQDDPTADDDMLTDTSSIPSDDDELYLDTAVEPTSTDDDFYYPSKHKLTDPIPTASSSATLYQSELRDDVAALRAAAWSMTWFPDPSAFELEDVDGDDKRAPALAMKPVPVLAAAPVPPRAVNPKRVQLNVPRQQGAAQAEQPVASKPAPRPKFTKLSQVVLHSLRGGARSFVIALACRGGLSFLLSLLKVQKRKMKFAEALRTLWGPDAVRFAKMVGSFSLIYKAILHLLFLGHARLASAKPTGLVASPSSSPSTGPAPRRGSSPPHRTLSEATLTNGSTPDLTAYADDNTAAGPALAAVDPTAVVLNARGSVPMFGIDRVIPFVAGSVAGAVAVLFETRANRVAVMQQIGIRSLQGYYNHLHARSLVHVPHGDSLLFMLACGSILYAYAMAPTTIPKEYYNWMVRIAQMPREMLELNRLNVRSLESTGRGLVDPTALATAIHAHGGAQAWKSLNAAHQFASRHGGHYPALPCSVLHPTTESCTAYTLSLGASVLGAMVPVNAALNVVPLVVFKPKEVLAAPVAAARRAVVATVRSSVFLAVFIAAFQAGVCGHRGLIEKGVVRKDHKMVYYALGAAAGASIFLEKRSRRSELVLYCLPKALESLYLLMLHRRLLVHYPGLDVLVTGLAMGNLMSLLRAEPEAVGGLLAKVVRRVVGE